MKLLPVIMMILLSISCEQGGGSGSSASNQNDQSIGQTNPWSETPSESLRARITIPIMFFNDFIDFRGIHRNVVRETINDITQTCELTTNNVPGASFYFDEKTLHLKLRHKDGFIPYERISGGEESINGSWQNISEEAEYTRITTFEFDDLELTITTICKFRD